MQRLLIAATLWCACTTVPALAQGESDSAAAPPWRSKVMYGGGPSIGAPPSDFTGATPPAQWCLQATGRTSGDYARSATGWTEMSVPWLHEVLTDSTDLGSGWRKVLGGAPQLSPKDSVTQVMDEGTCHKLAETVNRELLGWKVGPPPVVVLQARGYLIVFPSNANMGEFGLAVGMKNGTIQGVSTW